MVGGLHGIALGEVFISESIFNNTTYASKITLEFLVGWVKIHGFILHYCYFVYDHFWQFGTKETLQNDFLKLYDDALAQG